jgi:RNA polymerase sigma-70 factor, ECF subfamily
LQQAAIPAGDPLFAPFLGNRINPLPIEFQRLGRHRSQPRLAPVAEADETAVANVYQLVLRSFRQPAKDFDSFAPLAVGQQAVDAIQLRLDGVVDLIELDGIGQLELGGVIGTSPLGCGGSVSTNEQHGDGENCSSEPRCLTTIQHPLRICEKTVCGNRGGTEYQATQQDRRVCSDAVALKPPKVRKAPFLRLLRQVTGIVDFFVIIQRWLLFIMGRSGIVSAAGESFLSGTDSPYSQFADQLVAIQKGLYAYIMTLLPWPNEASDVLQQTNLVLWRDADRFQPGTDFRAWSYRVAYFQVLAQQRKGKRDRLRFDEELVKSLADQMGNEVSEPEEDALVLRECLKKLPHSERELICRRYDAGMSVKVMAADLQQTPNAIAVRLHRIRQTLLDCVQQGMSMRDMEVGP